MRHRLAPATRTDRVAEAADSLVALHSSDPVTVYLSISARMVDPTVDAIDHALYSARSVVRHHAMRRTLWVMTPEVARLAHASATVDLVAPQRRALGKLLADNGVADDPDPWLSVAIASIMSALDAAGEATTRQLGAALPSLRVPLAIAPGKSYGGSISAHTRVLTMMGFSGSIMRGRPIGSWVSGQYRWVAADRWLDGGLGIVDPIEAATAIADRYLRSFGPATASDVQWWTGWTKRKSAAALEAAGAVTVDGPHGEPLLIAADDDDDADDPGPWVALLPGLDPTVMGWKQRDWYLPTDRVPWLFDGNGNAGPTVWADGRVVGTWAQRPDGKIVHRVDEPLGPVHRRLLDDEIERVTSFVGDTRFTLRFPTPSSGELARDQ